VTINGRRDDEVRTVFACTPSVSLLLRCVERDAPCDNHKVDQVAMHEALVVSVCVREMIQEESFMWEDCTEAKPVLRTIRVSCERSLRTFSFLLRTSVDLGAFWHGHRPNIIVALFIILSSRRGIHVGIFWDIVSGAISSAFTEDGRVLVRVGHGLYDRGLNASSQAHTADITRIL
jgi:hypothetical protein